MEKKLLYLTKGRHATWLELFFDLIFVVGLGQVTHLLSGSHGGHVTWNNYLEFFVSFAAVWWLWLGHTKYSNLYDSDSKAHRVITLAIIFLLIIGTTSMGAHEFLSIYFILPYCIIRVVYSFLFIRGNKELEPCRALSMYTGFVILGGVAISLLSLLFDGHIRTLIFVGGIFTEFILFRINPYRLHRFPVDRDHILERVGLLALIMLGESVISIVYGLSNVQWSTTSISTAFFGFLIVCMIWWIYFDSFDLLEASKQDKSGTVILYSQLLTYMSFAILANSIRHAILLDISLSEFRIMIALGLFLHYTGKQIAYYVCLPEFRPYIVRNTIVTVVLGGAVTFLPSEQTILIGTSAVFLLFILLNRQSQMRIYGKSFV